MFYPSPLFESKICPPSSLDEAWARITRPIVFTNGCFDLLHRGHVTYLAQARALGASLIVALNTDASVRSLKKGHNRPIYSLAHRAAVIAALESVSLVTWFEEKTPLALIERIKPDVLVKGGDWAVDRIIGAAETQARGGKVYSIPFLFNLSTTETLKRIRVTDGRD